jgi:hypothetical protein
MTNQDQKRVEGMAESRYPENHIKQISFIAGYIEAEKRIIELENALMLINWEMKNTGSFNSIQSIINKIIDPTQYLKKKV